MLFHILYWKSCPQAQLKTQQQEGMIFDRFLGGLLRNLIFKSLLFCHFATICFMIHNLQRNDNIFSRIYPCWLMEDYIIWCRNIIHVRLRQLKKNTLQELLYLWTVKLLLVYIKYKNTKGIIYDDVSYS